MAGRLFDRLERLPDATEVFIEVNKIGAGEYFVARMLAATGGADVVLALVGSAWNGEQHSNRVLEPCDPVRL